MASGTWNAARFAANGQPLPATQPPPMPVQQQPGNQTAGQPVVDGGRSSTGGAQSGWQRNSPGRGKGGRGSFRGKGQGKGRGNQPLLCGNCNQLGHRSTDCRLTRAAKPYHTCYTCDGKGHWAADCPQNAAVQFLDNAAQQAQANNGTQPAAEERAPWVCYKCGAVGHRQFECNANW